MKRDFIDIYYAFLKNKYAGKFKIKKQKDLRKFAFRCGDYNFEADFLRALESAKNE